MGTGTAAPCRTQSAGGCGEFASSGTPCRRTSKGRLRGPHPAWRPTGPVRSRRPPPAWRDPRRAGSGCSRSCLGPPCPPQTWGATGPERCPCRCPSSPASGDALAPAARAPCRRRPPRGSAGTWATRTAGAESEWTAESWEAAAAASPARRLSPCWPRWSCFLGEPPSETDFARTSTTLVHLC